MHYYLYEIRNNLNGKIYVGVHKTANLDDGYMGSGTVIKSAIKKHGVDNFTKVILETFDTSEAMYAREAEIVTVEFLARVDVYNLRRGGFGGFDYIASLARSDDDFRESRMAAAIEQNRLWRANNYETARYNSSLGATAREKKSGSSFKRLNADPEFQAIRRLAFSADHSAGSKNSQYGTCWICHDLIGSRKCKKDDLPLYLDQGWIKGRKL